MSMRDFRLLRKSLIPVIERDETIDKKLIYTTGSVSDYMMSSLHDVIQYMCQKMNGAKTEILLVTSYWEAKSKAANLICETLKKLLEKSPKIVVRIIIDNGNIKNIFHHIRTIPREEWEKVLGLDIPDRHDVELRSIHYPLLGTIHAKFLIIDKSIAVLSSNNVQDRPNIELAVSMVGKVSESFVDIFERLWDGRCVKKVKNGEKQRKYIPSSMNIDEDYINFNMIVANRPPYGGLGKDVMTTQNSAIWTMMSIAREDILICSPTFNAEHAIKGVFSSCKRGVKVTLILTKYFNDKKESLPFQGGTNTQVVKKLLLRLKTIKCEKNLQVRWYVGENENIPKRGIHSHLKYMSIDKQICIFGNANMDTQSWYHSMEVNVILNDSNFSKQINTNVTKNSIEATADM